MSGGRRIQPQQLIHESALEFLRSATSSDKTKAKILLEDGSWVPAQDNFDFLTVEEDSQAKIVDDTILQANKRGVNEPIRSDFIKTILALVLSGKTILSSGLAMLRPVG